MKPLIVVTSCARDKAQGFHSAIRETWGKNCSVEYRFVLGAGNSVDASDELIFDVPDDHAHCTFKTRAAHKWAAENEFGFVLQAFTDTYLNLPAILSSNYEQYHYTGLFRGHFSSDLDFKVPDNRGRYAYASGGVGYWTSPTATQAIAQADIGDDPLMAWAEDLWAGTALGQAGFYGHHDERYRLEAVWHLGFLAAGRMSPHQIFSLHLGRGTGIYNPQWMYEAHKALAP